MRTDAVRSGGAGRGDGVVGAAQAVAHGDEAGRHVGEDARHKVGPDAARPALLQRQRRRRDVFQVGHALPGRCENHHSIHTQIH